MKKEGPTILAKNGKASFNYFLSDFLECGIALEGTEIKSIRNHGASLLDSYILIKNGECFILGMHIAPYKQGNIFNHDPLSTRKLLLHKEQIRKLEAKVKEKGYAILATKLYLSKGKAKVEIALGKGKHNYDKREVMKKRDQEKTIRQAIKDK